MSARVGAYVCPRGVSGIEYRVSRSGIEVVRSFDVPARIESERQAMDQLLGALVNANVRRADLALTLRGFGTVHHVLPMPPARDELLTPIVEREIRRLEPGLDAPTTSWLPLPGDPGEVSDGLPQRQVLAAGAPRHVVEAMEEAIRNAGHRLTHLTVLPAAMQRLYESFVGGTDPTALIAPLRDGAFLGFFISGAMRLVVEPPLAPDEQHDATALAEETELGAVFVRQQFRGAQLSSIALAAPPGVFGDADSAFMEKLGIPVSRVSTSDLSSGALAALGGVLDARSPAPLGLGTMQGKAGPSLSGRMRTASFAALGVAAAVALFAVYGAWDARSAAKELNATRQRIEQQSFGLSSIRQTAQQRKLVRDAIALLQLVEDDRRSLRQGLASLAGLALPTVRLDSVHVEQGPNGWMAIIAGRIEGESHARSVELLHEFYREIPRRLEVQDLVLDQMDYADGNGDERRAVKFRMSFMMPYPKES